MKKKYFVSVMLAKSAETTVPMTRNRLTGALVKPDDIIVGIHDLPELLLRGRKASHGHSCDFEDVLQLANGRSFLPVPEAKSRDELHNCHVGALAVAFRNRR